MTDVAHDCEPVASLRTAEPSLLDGLPPERAEAVRELLREQSALAERARRLIEATRDAILITDPARRIVFANPAAHALFGHPGQALLGMPAAETLVPEARDAVFAHESAALGGTPQRYETVVLRADGDRRVVSVSSSPLREGDAVTGVLASLRDITEERKARDAVARSEARYRNLVESASDAIYTMDARGVLTSVNGATCALAGAVREELLGRPVRVLLDPDEYRTVQREFQEALAGSARRFECHLLARDGSRRLLSVTNAPVFQGTSVIGVLGIARDITAEREREAALRRSEARYERLVEIATDAIFTLDLDGRFTSVNRSVEVSIGHPRAALLGRRFTEILDGEQREVAEGIFRAAIGGRPVRSELSYRDAEGSPRTGSIVATPVLEGDRISGVLAVVRDVTEERHLAQQLLQREKLAAVGQLVSGVAHELNNPLAGIMAFAQLLEGWPESSPEQRDAVETIHREAKRAARIVSNLLLFARQRTPEREYTDLNQVMRDTLELRRYVLRTQQIEIATELDPGLPRVWADPFQMQQVVLNLLTNAEHAVRAVAGPRRITLATRRRDGTVVASVGDSGAGIEPAQLAQIFNPFYTTKEVGEGTGLGLSISDGIVRQHGGQIVVHSRRGEGSTFAIELPLVDPPADATPPRAARVERPPRARSLLIVDDEPSIRRALVRFLERDGHHVDAAASGPEALQLIAQRRYDGILLDLRMPDMAGDALYEQLCRCDPALAARVVFATGDTESDSARAFLAAAGRPVLAKPFVLPDVAELLCGLGQDG